MSTALTKARVEQYERDGFIILQRFFEPAEIEPLLDAYREGPTVGGSLYGMVDNYGAPHPICIWTELADDILGIVPRLSRIVESTEAILGEPCYHWHSKLTVKPPGCEAHVDWHQDFGSWYDDGVLFPSLLTIGIAIEPATRENGCLQVIPGSHRMGLMDYRNADVFNNRFERARERLGLVYCEMEAGDAVIFHCNTLHGSDNNESEDSRLMLFASYNARSNEPVADARGNNEDGAFMGIPPDERLYKPIQKLPDDTLAKKRFSSAFGATVFKEPITDLGDSYSQAAELQ